MKRLEIRGVIVPSEYDSDWTRKYIEKGLITPESTFRRALAEQPADGPLSVYINSPGGSVFSAYEMVNAVREWKAENKQPVYVTIGAMAASAASAFAISVGAKVRAHQNAKMMFHGASSETWGGKGAHEDTAELLEKINAEIQQALIGQYKMDPDTVAEWFAEGRMGWLNAEEMYKTGIADEVIGEDDAPINFDADAVAAIDAKGLDIAALLEEPDASDESDGSGEGNTSETATDQPDSQNAGGDTGDLVIEYQRGFEDGQAKGKTEIAGEYADQISELKTSLETAQAESRKFQGMADKLAAQLKQAQDEGDRRASELRSQLDEATEKLRKYVSGALKFTPSIETWEDALAACDGNYAKAAKGYPELLNLYRANHNRS